MKILLSILVLGCAIAPAAAQTVYWSESFDSYSTGQLPSGTGGWLGWDNVPGALGDIVTMPALSAPNAFQINPPDDTIQPFVLNDPTGYPRSCAWQMTAWWYIPSSTFVSGSGNQYFLIQNTYQHGGPYTWTIQLEANPNTMMVSEYHTYMRLNFTVPVILDQWVFVQADIDLDNDTLVLYYDNQIVCSGSYTTAAGEPTEIACLDLFTDSTTTSTAYWDDFTLTRLTGPEYQQNQPAASLDVNGITGSLCGPSVATFISGTLTTLTLGGNPGAFWDMALTAPEPTVPLSGGGVPTPGGQLVNINVLAPSFFFLNPPFPFAPASLPFTIPASPFQVSAQMVVLDPTLPDLFGLSQAIEIISVPCDNPQNFDALVPGTGAYPTGWGDGGGTAEWAVHTGGTTSGLTGPTAANSLPNYMYCETSGTGGTSNFKVNTCRFDTTGFPAPTLNFALSRIGVSIGTLVVRQDDGSGTFPIVLMTYVGPDLTQTQFGIEWSNESLPIDTTTPGAIPVFQFDYTAGGTFTGDLAIDDVQVM